MSPALITLVVHVVIPLGLTALIAFPKPKSRLALMAKIALGAVYLFFLTRAGAGWALVSANLPMGFWAVFTAGSLYGAWRSFDVSFFPKRALGWLLALVPALATVALAFPVLELDDARAYEGEATKLLFPLKRGTFFVVNGGALEVMNRHAAVKAQRYALDIVALDELGRSAAGLAPGDVAAYAIFGAEVVAPCSGTVLSVENELKDLAPPERDPVNLAGNHVLLFCDDVTVALAHLKQGSVVVKEGERVKTGKKVGEVGNSGNTSEPHLHIHAVKGEVKDLEEMALDAEAVPMTFGGRFLIRNDRVVVK